MKTNINIVTTVLKYESDEYKRKYDEIQNARERELREANDTYKPGCRALIEKKEQINSVCDSSLTKLRVETADRTLKDVELLRQQEMERVQAVNEPLLAKIRAIADVPMTSLELSAFAQKINAKGDYWAARMLADIAERNGIDTAEISLESAYDTKMSVLDQLTEQLNGILKYYGTKDPAERPKAKYLYLSDEILERAKQMYGGSISRLSDGEKADRAYFTVRTQQTDIQKGIAIANVLRNAEGEVRNKILVRLAEDKTISCMAAEFSGRLNEITEFRNGKAAEYRAAEKAMENIRRMKNKTFVEQKAAEMEENTFFRDMFTKEKNQNTALAELLYGQPGQDGTPSDQQDKPDRHAQLYKAALDRKAGMAE